MSNVNEHQKVSLYRIIGNVVGDLGIPNVNQHLSNMARWAVDAEILIGSRNSTERVECEIEIKGRRACLPDGFQYLHGLNIGGKILNVTKRDFRMFNKAATNPVVQKPDRFNGGDLRIYFAGVSLCRRITFGGLFSVGNTIVITVAMNNCGNMVVHTFTRLVIGGDTLTSIAAGFAGEMNAIDNIGFTVTPGGGFIDILADHVDITFTLAMYTDSVSGTLKQTIIQQHQPARNTDLKMPEGCDVTPKQGSHNLANLEAFNINTGHTAQNGGFGNNLIVCGEFSNASTYTIDNGYIFVNFMDNGRVGISYEKICLDEDGWPLVHHTHEIAVTQYLMWKYKSVEYYNNKLDHHIFVELRDRWYWLCGQARGDDEMPDAAEMRYMASQWNQLLPPPSKNIF